MEVITKSTLDVIGRGNIQFDVRDSGNFVRFCNYENLIIGEKPVRAT